ncbi:MAG: hypothetical protein AAB965_00385 [Patescibacteria group bacterium]
MEGPPLYKQGVVELVPTSWIWNYWGRDVSPETNLMDGRMVGLDELWENIKSEGLHDPLIMRVGLNNKKFRLESGNHRIQVLHAHGVEMIPLTVQAREECGPHLEDVMTDASHNFDAGDELLISEITREYMKPSEVFRSLVGGIGREL